MKTVQEIIKETVEEMGAKLSAEEKKEQERMVTEMLVNGKFAKEAAGVSPECLEFIYGGTLRLYNSGQYPKAELMFQFLSLLDPSSFRFRMGIAACRHMQKKYGPALDAYGVCIPLDPKSPLPYYHAADCYIHMDALPMALRALELTITTAGEDPQYKKIAERSLAMMRSIIEKLELPNEKNENVAS
jgi:type III secretion system low calcium response chaperone LcrH/SycD